MSCKHECHYRHTLIFLISFDKSTACVDQYLSTTRRSFVTKKNGQGWHKFILYIILYKEDKYIHTVHIKCRNSLYSYFVLCAPVAFISLFISFDFGNSIAISHCCFNFFLKMSIYTHQLSLSHHHYHYHHRHHHHHHHHVSQYGNVYLQIILYIKQSSNTAFSMYLTLWHRNFL